MAGGAMGGGSSGGLPGPINSMVKSRFDSFDKVRR